MSAKRKSTSEPICSPISPKRNKHASPSRPPVTEPHNAFPISTQTTEISMADELSLDYLRKNEPSDPLYNKVLQNLFASRLSVRLTPKRVLDAMGQTFGKNADVSDCLRIIPKDILAEQIMFWIFQKFASVIKSEDYIKEAIKIMLKRLPDGLTRATLLKELAPKLDIPTTFFQDGKKVETRTENGIDEAQGNELHIEDNEEKKYDSGKNIKEQVITRPELEAVGGLLRSIPDKIERCKALADIISDIGLKLDDESQDNVINTTGMIIGALLDTLGKSRSKTDVLTHILLRSGGQSPKELVTGSPKDDAKSETVRGDEPETMKETPQDMCEESAQSDRSSLIPKTPFERLESIMASLDSDELRRHCVRRLAQLLNLDFFRSEYPAETTAGRRVELDEDVGVPQSLWRQDNQECIRQSTRRTVAICKDRLCDCHRPDQFPKGLFTKVRWPFVELMCHVLDDELKAEQATRQRDKILAFLQKRVAGRKCHHLCTSIELADKTYEFDLSNHGRLSHQILTALQQSSDSHGGGGDSSRRALVNRTLGPFIYANFPLFPELSDIADLTAYGKPVVIDNTLYLRVEAIKPPVDQREATKALSKSERRQPAPSSYAWDPPQGPHSDQYSSPGFAKPSRTQSFPMKYPESVSPYSRSPQQQRSRGPALYPARSPQQQRPRGPDLYPARSPQQQRSRVPDLYPARSPSPRDQRCTTQFPDSVKKENYRREPSPFRQDADRIAPVAPRGPRY